MDKLFVYSFGVIHDPETNKILLYNWDSLPESARIVRGWYFPGRMLTARSDITVQDGLSSVIEEKTGLEVVVKGPIAVSQLPEFDGRLHVYHKCLPVEDSSVTVDENIARWIDPTPKNLRDYLKGRLDGDVEIYLEKKSRRL